MIKTFFFSLPTIDDSVENNLLKQHEKFRIYNPLVFFANKNITKENLYAKIHVHVNTFGFHDLSTSNEIPCILHSVFRSPMAMAVEYVNNVMNALFFNNRNMRGNLVQKLIISRKIQF